MTITVQNNKVRLYDTIYHGDATYIISELEKIKSDLLDIHLHTSGGSVFDGNLIYNYLKSRKVNIYIDGMCASMGTIIMLAGEKIYMSENAHIMIHAPTGMTWGTAKHHRENVRLLESMESNFISKYKNKTGKSTKDVKEWLDGDNWFDAKKAKEEGLIDEIVGEVIDNDEIISMQSSFINISMDLNLKKTNKKMKEKLIERLKLEDVSKESTEEQVIHSLQNKIVSLQNKIEEFEKAKKEDYKNSINKIVTNAIKEGRITSEKKENYLNIGMNSGINVLENIINDLKVYEPIHTQISQNIINNSSKKLEDYTELELQALKKENIEEFNKLIKK